MYPGYSPADHIYGEASQEYGQRYSEMKKQGIELKQGPDGIEYVVGQSSKDEKEQFTDLKRRREQENQPTVSDDVDGDEDGSILFTFDSNPTPVDQLKSAPSTTKSGGEPRKKTSAPGNSLIEARLARMKVASDNKKQDTQADYLPLSQPQTNGNDEFEKAVAERKAKKDEKRRQKNAESSREKDGKKRKRQSDSSQITPAPVDPATTEPLAERPKKKKSKTSHKDAIVLRVVEAAPAGKDAAPVTLLQETSAEKKKHKKRSAEDDVNGVKETQAEERDQRHKKRRKASD